VPALPMSLTPYAVRAVVVAGVVLVWASLFTFPPLVRLAATGTQALQPLLPAVVGWPGWDHVLASSVKVAAAGALLAAVPVVLHGPARAGLLPPTPTGARLTLVAFFFAAAATVAGAWGVVGARVAHAVERPQPWTWLGVDAVLIAAEHLLAQGGVLALALPFGLPVVDERRRVGLPGLRFLAGLGVGGLENARLAGPSTFLAVPVEAWPAIGAQAVVFTLVDYVPVAGSPWLALVGGLAAGWLAARTGSLWPAVLVRLATSHVPVAAFAIFTA